MSSDGVGGPRDPRDLAGASEHKGQYSSDDAAAVDNRVDSQSKHISSAGHVETSLAGRVDARPPESFWSKVCRFFSGRLGVHSPRGIEYRKELKTQIETAYENVFDYSVPNSCTAGHYVVNKQLANLGFELRGNRIVRKQGLEADVARAMLKDRGMGKGIVAICLGSRAKAHNAYERLETAVKKCKENSTDANKEAATEAFTALPGAQTYLQKTSSKESMIPSPDYQDTK